ncbi:MAG: carbon dioxide concentrating mechanism protein [Oscillatoria princeps RMCB-10]|jgi:carbon dioxide concentrating mechanism protein CcmN|nr:carbon dioxide concentrating mechanism protein [Oscillatoria princeps RMCB-10]
MHLPLLRPISTASYFVSGDVVIDECAAIGPGVILQADAGSRIVIAAGVCIGMGAILHAHQGNIEVEAGANLGAGVLIVGTGKIGANACVGAATTVLNSSIQPTSVVPAASIIGDTSRQVALTPDPVGVGPTGSQPPAEGVAANSQDSAATGPPAAEPAPAPPEPQSPVSPTPAYSQRHLNRLMMTLFPNGQSLNRNSFQGPPVGDS